MKRFTDLTEARDAIVAGEKQVILRTASGDFVFERLSDDIIVMPDGSKIPHMAIKRLFE